MIALVLEHPRIFSPTRFNDIANTPLWSCLLGGYAVAMLEQTDLEVRYLDAPNQNLDFETTTRQVLNIGPDLLCVNGVYFWENTPRLFQFFDQLREKGFEGHLNLFGFFPSLAWQEILSLAPSVDSVAVGECERTLSDLARALSENRSIEDIPGLALKTASGPALSRWRQPAKDPDEFPRPFRRIRPGETASILASRGCYNHCSFCPIPEFYHQGPLWRGRDPEKVVSEMAELRDRGAGDIYFIDPNFIGPGGKGRQRVLDLADKIESLGLTFGMETRPNDLDEDVVGGLVRAGLTSLLLGIESGSGKILTSLNKHASDSVSSRAVDLCRQAGIEPEIGFIMFVPEAGLDDLAENFSFLQANQLLDRLDRTANLLSHRQIVLKGTRGYTRYVEEGRLKPAGMFGFEGRVEYLDPGAAWMAEVMGRSCLTVLREAGSLDSPLYFENPLGDVEVRVNDYLTGLFEELLDRARAGILPPAEEVSEEQEAILIRMLRET